MTRIIIGLLLFIFGGSGPEATAPPAPNETGAPTSVSSSD
jgi:hypothetical protein